MSLARRWRARGAALALGTLVLAPFVVGGGALAPPGAAAAEPEPTITIQEMVGSQGPVTMVRLAGWPTGTVNVSTCTGEGDAPSQECDLVGARTADVDAEGNGTAPLPPEPLVGCPCVVRVSTNANDVVRVLPIGVPGLPTATPDPVTPIVEGTPKAEDLEVAARVDDRERTWDESALVALGASGPQDLVIDLHNSGPVATGPLDGSITVRRDGSAGAARSLPTIAPLAPGEVRVLSIPLTLPAPSVGDYEVVGLLRGLDGPLEFTASTNERRSPMTVLLVALLLAVVVLLARRSWRRRASRRS